MINKILKDIDNEECYYVGTNGCLYKDLDKEELLAIKQEIERLNKSLEEQRHFYLEKLQQKENIIKEVREYTSKTQMPEGYKKMILEILDKE